MRIVAYCLMPNHWHLVLWPNEDAAVSAYIHWLTGTHACHFNARHALTGHVYQGRFKAVRVLEERHLLTLLRYVESNPVSAGLVERAEQWHWSSVGPLRLTSLHPGPVPRPSNWSEMLAGLGPGGVKDVKKP
jgi:putative transposase